MGVTWNPFIDNLDFTGSGGSGTTIPEYATDPVSPAANSAWVLKTVAGGISIGSPIGLLLALTYAVTSGGSTTYQFSYRTTEATTIRTTLS